MAVYTYNGQVITNGGQVYVPAPSTPSFTPTDISGLELWLDAADNITITESVGRVTTWADKSINGFDVTQGNGANQPTYTDGEYVYFDGNRFMINDDFNIVSSAYSLFFVGQLDNKATTATILDGGGNADCFQVGYAAGGPFMYGFNRPFAENVNYNTFNALQDYVWEYETSGANANLLLNNSIVDSSTIQPVLTQFDNFTLGSTYARPNQTFRGKMREIIIYNSVLSETDRTSVYNYLSNKWSI